LAAGAKRQMARKACSRRKGPAGSRHGVVAEGEGTHNALQQGKMRQRAACGAAGTAKAVKMYV